MRIAKVIGTVTLSRAHPSLISGRLKLATPLSLKNITENLPATADPVVVYDDLGVMTGSHIMFSEGSEASQPFYPDVKPIDAYNSGILDEIQIEP